MARKVVGAVAVVALLAAGCAAPSAMPDTNDVSYRPAPEATQTAKEQTAPPLEYYPRVAGYDRSCSPGHSCSFGPTWSDDVDEEFGHNGCDTRNDILRQDLIAASVDPNTRGCVVASGTLVDPYSGQQVEYRKGASTVQIDHVIPLAAAWDRGAWQWTADQRRNFANDPTNLQATTSTMNGAKGDRMPGDWMPPVGRCEYARRVASAADKWALPLTSRDIAALKGCQD